MQIRLTPRQKKLLILVSENESIPARDIYRLIDKGVIEIVSEVVVDPAPNYWLPRSLKNKQYICLTEAGLKIIQKIKRKALEKMEILLDVPNRE